MPAATEIRRPPLRVAPYRLLVREAAQALEFEKAASLRDQIREMKEDYGL